MDIEKALTEIASRWREGVFTINHLPTAIQSKRWMAALFAGNGMPYHFYGETAREMMKEILSWLSEREK